MGKKITMKKFLVWLLEELILPMLAMALVFLPVTVILILIIVIVLIIIF